MIAPYALLALAFAVASVPLLALSAPGEGRVKAGDAWTRAPSLVAAAVALALVSAAGAING